MPYKELTQKELVALAQQVVAKGASPALISYVRKHYPGEAVAVRYAVSSEYNDEGYDRRLGYASVRDAEGREVYPLEGKESTHRKVLMENGPSLSNTYEEPDDEDIVLMLAAMPFKVYKEVA